MTIKQIAECYDVPDSLIEAPSFNWIPVPVELTKVIKTVLQHYEHAKEKHPVFPVCLKEQTNIVIEESLEFIQQVNNENKSEAIHELGQLCAVSLRVLHHNE